MIPYALILTQTHIEEMIRHARTQAPLEACGLLAGRDARVESVLLVANADQSPARFRMDPYEQLRAFDWIDTRGLDLVGIFHSHPSGPEAVSPTDIAEAAYEVVHVILSQHEGKWRARGFWIEAGRSTDVPLAHE